MTTGTLVDVVMPQMGVSVSEGTITRWPKQVGEPVEADETIVEISTDKVDTEVPSPAQRHRHGAARRRGRDGAVEHPHRRDRSGERGTAERRAGAAGRPDSAEADAGPRGRAGERGRASAAAPSRMPADGATDDDRPTTREARSFMSPVVARMLAEHNSTSSQIPGTGRGGRVTKKDVQASSTPAAPGRAGGARRAALRAARRGAARRRRRAAPHRRLPPPPRRAAPAAAAPPPPAPATRQALVASGGDEELYQFSTIRKVIARHMRAVARDGRARDHGVRGRHDRRREHPQGAEAGVPAAPRRQADLHAVRRARRPSRRSAAGRGSTPRCAASRRSIKQYVNLGVAVAVDDSKGLMVPVIHNAEEKNLLGLSRSVIELADRARTKTLTPDEMSGGTFTITNPGVFGALIGTPIIPEGQVAIIDVEAIVKRPVVVTDEHGNDSIAIRSMMFLCLSYDHRLVDGAYAAQFMAQVKSNLETWDERPSGCDRGVRREARRHALRDALPR